jgi:adenylate cyclase
MSEATDALMDALDVPVLHLDGDGWVVRYANRCALTWLDARVGEPLVASMPSLDRARIESKLKRGRESKHEQRTNIEPSFLAEYYFRALADGTILVEGRSAAALEEAQAMVSSYSLMVEKQKRQIEVEKTRVEKLLLNILPRKSVEQLRQFGRTIPERFDDVSVLFLDFVGFTALSQTLSPEELFSELNDIFSAFDDIITRYGCERIKTIGDAYLAVCGMPEANPMHAPAIVTAALAMRAFIRDRNATTRHKWACRIGIHSGSVTAGVVGRLKYIYDIFGDGVNTASRMESHAEPMTINVSESTRALLDPAAFSLSARAPVDVKGKGTMRMHFVDEVPELELHEPELPSSESLVGVAAIFDEKKFP